MTSSKRNDKRQETRGRLRFAAAISFARLGVRGASIDSICEAAGYSRGAFYANYSSKDELLLELMAEMLVRESGVWRRLVDEALDVDSMLEKIAKRFERSNQTGEWGLLAAELQLHAERDAEFGQRYYRFMAEHHSDVAELFVAIFRKAGKFPPAPAEDIAASAMSLGNSLSLQASHGVRKGDPDYARCMFVLYLRGLIEIAEPIPITS